MPSWRTQGQLLLENVIKKKQTLSLLKVLATVCGINAWFNMTFYLPFCAYVRTDLHVLKSIFTCSYGISLTSFRLSGLSFVDAYLFTIRHCQKSQGMISVFVVDTSNVVCIALEDRTTRGYLCYGLMFLFCASSQRL